MFQFTIVCFQSYWVPVYQKHSTGFESPSPPIHFLNFAATGKSIQQQHNDWLEDIRQNIWDRIKFENEMIPSTGALFLHWQRSCWVVHMRMQADKNILVLHPITNYGWTLTDGKLPIIWDK